MRSAGGKHLDSTVEFNYVRRISLFGQLSFDKCPNPPLDIVRIPRECAFEQLA
jgi:hypothetical protein